MRSEKQQIVEAVQAELDQKTKPAGSLNHIDALAVRMAVAQRTTSPRALPAKALLFAADHGVSADGVSLYPREVTAQMVMNFATGGAAVCTFAQAAGADVAIYDVGVDADPFDHPAVHDRRVARGTANLRTGAAMTEAQYAQALNAGRQALADAVRAGVRCVAIGEMGIGNTTSASALLAVRLGVPAQAVTGPGTGVQGDALQRKIALIDAAITRAIDAHTPERRLQELGGFEIVAMTGVCLAAVSLGVAVVVDGFIASIAALYAMDIDGEVADQLVWAHRSSEPGHDLLLAEAKAQPILDMGLRLGEASGAMLALPILHAACTMLDAMATFASAGVTNKDEGE